MKQFSKSHMLRGFVDTRTCTVKYTLISPHTCALVSFQTKINVSIKRIAGKWVWCVGAIEPGWGEISVSVRKTSSNCPTSHSHLPSKVERAELAGAESSSLSAGCWGSFTAQAVPPAPRCWTPPGCVLLACRVLSHLSRV